MTDHHEALRVAPDPLLAEELRRRLHARLAGGDVDERVVEPVGDRFPPFETEPDDAEGDLLMLTTDDRPTDGEPPTPGRTVPRRWLLVAAAAAVIAVGATLARDDDQQVDTSTAPTPPARDILDMDPDEQLEPGWYFIDPDGDPSTSLVVLYQVAAEGWSPWQGAVKFDGDVHTAINITTVDNVAVDACRDHRPADPPVGPSVEDLADALAGLEPFELSEAPSEVTVFGYDGIHLQLTVPGVVATGADADRPDFTHCVDGELASWSNDHYLGGPFSGYADEPGRTEDFWILDVDGQRIVIETNEGPSSSAADIAERNAIFDSIVIRP